MYSVQVIFEINVAYEINVVYGTASIWLARKWPLTKVVQVLIARNIVAHVEPSLPSTKQWKPWPQLQLYRILLRPQITGWDVANFIPIIYITGSSWQNCLERLDGRRSCCTLIIISRKCTLEGKHKRLVKQTRKSRTAEWQGSKFIFGFGSTCATRCKFLGALPKF